MNIKLNQSIITNELERPTQETLLDEENADEIQIVIKESKDLVSRSKDNLNAAIVNFIVNIETTIAIVLILNQGIPNPRDRITYGIAIISILFSYLMSFLLNGDQPFFKGFSLAQAYIIQTQIIKYGKNSIYSTCFLTGLIVICLTAVKLYRIVRVTPVCMLIALQISVGKQIN